MAFHEILSVFNDVLVFVFGLLLSAYISGSCGSKKEKRSFALLCAALLLVQGAVLYFWDAAAVRSFYPLLVHLPLFVFLVLGLKKKAGFSLIAVFTAYLCCQLPRWPKLLADSLCANPLVGELCYTLFIVPIFFILRRWFARPARDAMSYSTQSLLLFGSLPFAYYIFDYTTTVYSDALYRGSPALTELFPTAIVAFYIIFLTAYHAQSQKRSRAELQNSMLEVQLRQSDLAVNALRRKQYELAIYRHDMRHHLSMVDSFLAADKPLQAREYVENVFADMEELSMRRYCENEIVDLLCASFDSKAQKCGLRFSVNAKLPKNLFISDTELCSLVSNGLENAFHAAAETADGWVELYCDIKLNKLLIEIRNSCIGEVPLQDGLPAPSRPGHGYGCRSIRAISQQRHGLCSFQSGNNVFTLRIAIPVCCQSDE